MQFSENWLRTMVDPKLTSDELAHLLTMSGLEVEEVEPVAPPFSQVVVAKVVEVARHPDADRLNVCQVDIGTGTLLNIVCGAPNVSSGMKVPCAIVGAKLPALEDGKVFEIKLGKLRGVESQGMLCSAYELKLSEERDGLLKLPDDAPIGQNFRDYYQLNDLKFTIKLTPNKADCLSVMGVAREISALTGSPLKMPTFQQAEITTKEILKVVVSAPDLCGRFSGRIIRGLNAKAPTPEWMKQRLERSGQRSISALVDISNYIMLELGRPSHVFDLSKIHGGLEVRWGKSGETLKLINGNTISVDESVGVIADESGIESLAGIMGGDFTSVSLDTKDIYLEAAFWQPKAIQGRARRYNFSTDAAHRFERGVDYATTVEHLERITSLLIQICGGEETMVGPINDHIVALPERKPVSVRTARASKIIGVPITDEQISNIFTRLGLAFLQEPGLFKVTPPSYRFDIEIEEDLIEEIARIYGFENIPALPPIAPQIMSIAQENTRSLFDVRRKLADFDYQEVVNFSFVDEQWERDFAENSTPIRLLNPISAQMNVMRSNLIASLIANVRYNLNRKITRIRLFEVGSVYLHSSEVQDSPATIAGYSQPKKVGAIAYGAVVEEQWGQPTRNIDYYDVKADLEALFLPKKLQFVKEKHVAFHPGRTAKILFDGNVIGFLGELHPSLQQKYDLPLAPVIFEVDAGALLQCQIPAYQEISKFPAVTRDVALVVHQEVAAQSLIEDFISEGKLNPLCAIMQAIVLFDEYRGKGLRNEEKSLAFRFTLQDTQSTLQDEKVDTAITAFIAVAEKKYGAKLRG